MEYVNMIRSLITPRTVATTVAILIALVGLQGCLNDSAPSSKSVERLVDAAGEGSESLVRDLLDEGVDINAVNKHDETALMRAAYHSHCYVIELLLERGANVNFRNKRGYTPLMFAAMARYQGAAARLLEGGAEINAADNDGNTALMFAANANYGTDVVHLLLEKGAEVNAVNKEGQTALMIAASRGGRAVVELLVANGAKGQKGETAMPRVGGSSDGGADQMRADARNELGDTPLIRAARNGDREKAKLLLDKGADVNGMNYFTRESPLACALKKGHVRTSWLLFKRSASVAPLVNSWLYSRFYYLWLLPLPVVLVMLFFLAYSVGFIVLVALRKWNLLIRYSVVGGVSVIGLTMVVGALFAINDLMTRLSNLNFWAPTR
jgi:ankyrin repeat protein